MGQLVSDLWRLWIDPNFGDPLGGCTAEPIICLVGSLAFPMGLSLLAIILMGLAYLISLDPPEKKEE